MEIVYKIVFPLIFVNKIFLSQEFQLKNISLYSKKQI